MNVPQWLMIRIERDLFIAKSFPLSAGTYDAIQFSLCRRPVLSILLVKGFGVITNRLEGTIFIIMPITSLFKINRLFKIMI